MDAYKNTVYFLLIVGIACIQDAPIAIETSEFRRLLDTYATAVPQFRQKRSESAPWK